MSTSEGATRFPSGPDAEPSEITAHFRFPYVALASAICLVPLLLFVVFASHQRGKIMHNGEISVARTVQILEEHALRVFEAQQLIIDQTDQYLEGMDWRDIRTSAE